MLAHKHDQLSLIPSTDKNLGMVVYVCNTSIHQLSKTLDAWALLGSHPSLIDKPWVPVRDSVSRSNDFLEERYLSLTPGLHVHAHIHTPAHTHMPRHTQPNYAFLLFYTNNILRTHLVCFICFVLI